MLDFKFEKGDLIMPLKLVAGIDQIQQQLAAVLQFFQGEYYLNTAVGLPYYQGMLDKGASRSLIESEFKAAILNVRGVLSIASFQSFFDPRTRTYGLQFAAQTSEGLVELQVELLS